MSTSRQDFFPTRIPACGPPRSLSPEQVTASAPARTEPCSVGLAVDAERFKVEKAAAAEVLEKRQAAGMSERGKLLAARALGKADDAVVAGVDLHQRAGMLTDGGGIVRGAGLVGRADLAQRRAAGRT